MNYVEAGVAIVNMVALFIGWITMLLGGAYLFIHAADWLFLRTLERGLRSFDAYHEFLAFALPRIRAKAIARRERRNAE